MKNSNEILAHWYEQLAKIYKFAHRKNLIVNLRLLIKDIEDNDNIIISPWNESKLHVDIERLDLKKYQLTVGFIRVGDEYKPLFPADIVYVGKQKYIVCDGNVFDDELCCAKECDTDRTVYLKFEDMLLIPDIEYIKIDGNTIVKPRRIDSSQVSINYNNVANVLYQYKNVWYEFDKLEDKNQVISHLNKIFE